RPTTGPHRPTSTSCASHGITASSSARMAAWRPSPRPRRSAATASAPRCSAPTAAPRPRRSPMANSQPETPRPLAPHELQARLQRFTGSETFYTHFTGRLIYTEGVQYLAEHAGAYWLIDAIASWQTEPKVRAAPFQV